MLAIKRRCSNRIISRAPEAEGEPMPALLKSGAEDCEICANAEQLEARLETEPRTTVVYNQHANAVTLVEGLEVSTA